MDALHSLPLWAQAAVGLFAFVLILALLAQLLGSYTQWRLRTQRERWQRLEEAKQAQELDAFWASNPSTEAEALFWQSVGQRDPSTILSMVAGADPGVLRRHISGSNRFLLPAVEAAREAGVPVAERSAWIATKVLQLKDEFNADPANAREPWQ